MRLVWFVLFVATAAVNPPFVVGVNWEVEGVLSENPKPNPYPLLKLQETLKQIILTCTSEKYIFVNQPGLLNDDFANSENFVGLQRELSSFKSLISYPFLKNYASIDKLATFTQRQCRVNGYKRYDFGKDTNFEIEQRTASQIITVELPRLPTNDKRKDQIMHNDEILTKLIKSFRKVPVFVVITSLESSEQDERYLNQQPHSVSKYIRGFHKLSTSYDPFWKLQKEISEQKSEHNGKPAVVESAWTRVLVRHESAVVLTTFFTLVLGCVMLARTGMCGDYFRNCTRKKDVTTEKNQSERVRAKHDSTNVQSVKGLE